MIRQLTPVRRVARREKINRDFAQARRIQAKLKGRIIDAVELENGILWSPVTKGPYLVPIIGWIK